MTATLKLGADNNWATKEGKLLGYNDENGNFKPIPFDVTSDADTTRVNKEGLIERTKTNVPRINFDGADNPYLLLEPTRANFVFPNNSLTGYSTSNVTITNNDTIAPNGTNEGAKVQATSSGGAVVFKGFTSTASSATHNFSAFVKAGTHNILQIQEGFAAANIVVDLSDGTEVSSQNATNKKIEEYPNGWYRVSFNFTSSGTNLQFSIYFSGGHSSGDNYYVWGGQIEVGSYATSLIPTSDSAVTRTADTCQITGLERNITSGATEATLYVELEFENESNGDAMQWRSSTSNAGRAYFYATQMGFADTYGANGVTIFGLTENSTIKAAFRLNSLSNATVFLNGVKGNTGNGNTWGDIGQLILNATYWKMKIYQIQMYNEALTDAELITLTS